MVKRPFFTILDATSSRVTAAQAVEVRGRSALAWRLAEEGKSEEALAILKAGWCRWGRENDGEKAERQENLIEFIDV